MDHHRNDSDDVAVPHNALSFALEYCDRVSPDIFIKLGEAPGPWQDSVVLASELWEDFRVFGMHRWALRRGMPALLARSVGFDGAGRTVYLSPITGDDDLGHLAAVGDTLERLCLQKCNKLTAAAWRHLLPLQHLRTLDLSLCSAVCDDVLITVAALGSLKVLNLGDTSISDSGLAHLERGSTALEELTLSRSAGVTDACLASLATLPELRSIDLSDCVAVRDPGIAALARAPKLETLHVRRCGLQGNTLSDVTVHLVGLDLTGILGVKLTGLGALRAMRSLNLTNVSLKDDDLRHLSGLLQLESLVLAVNKLLTGHGFEHIVHLEQLKEVVAYRCDLLEDAGLILLSQLRAIAFINVNNCPLVSNRGVSALASVPSLRRLDVVNCRKFTRTALEAVRSVEKVNHSFSSARPGM